MHDPSGRQNPPPEPNPAATQEKADRSRNAHDTEPAGGISNRPREQEREEQQQLPPRGERKEEGHA